MWNIARSQFIKPSALISTIFTRQSRLQSVSNYYTAKKPFISQAAARTIHTKSNNATKLYNHHHSSLNGLIFHHNIQVAESKGPGAAVTSAPPVLPYTVGETISGFELKSIDSIEDYNLLLYRFNHNSTGASYVHISRADDDNSFSICFNTHPYSSNGIPHILEHVTLCGSKRYPVRDPFFLLNRRSLKTYMNALTASDYTMYPFSTQNSTDYNNLMAVYLDSAFFPLLRKQDFLQEGHRVEVREQKSNGAAVDLEFKGVVYNEMKGAMSDSNSLFAQRFQSAIFNDPENVYYHNSGGEPNEITNLTHEELVNFHRKYYHPSNAMLISYGDKPPQLDIVNSTVLKHFTNQGNSKQSSNKPVYIPVPPRDSTVRVEFTCPPDPVIAEENKQYKFAINYLCNSLYNSMPAVENSQLELDLFSMHILGSLLLDGPSSPMYQALIEPNLGSGYAPGTGFDTSTKQPSFTIGVNNCDEAQYNLIEKTIEKTLEKVREEGFPAERIDAILHQLELSLKHVRAGFGIGIVMRLNSLWAHDKNIVSSLKLNDKIQQFREKLALDAKYLQNLLQKHVINNSHRTIATMKPDSQYNDKENEHELNKLQQISAKLTQTDKQNLIEQAAALKAAQETKSDPTILPSLTIDNIKKSAELVEFQPLTVKINGQSQQLQFLAQPTNGCVYYRAVTNLSSLSLDLYPFLALYTSFLSEMGTKSLNYRDLSHKLDLFTGGLGASVRIHTNLNNLNQFIEYLFFKGMSLNRNFDNLLNLTSDIVTTANFNDLNRLAQLINQSAAAASNSLQDSGNVYAKLDAASRYGYTNTVAEMMGGITFVKFINQLQAQITSETANTQGNTQVDYSNNRTLQQLSEKLKEVQQFVVSQGLERVLAVGEEKSKPLFSDKLHLLLNSVRIRGDKSDSNNPSISEKGFQPEVNVNQLSSEENARRRFFLLPISVNYVCYVIPTGVYYTHPDAAVFDVLTRLLSNCYLHREIREIGGAYGSGASHSSDGLFYMTSYRDPNSENTVNVFQNKAHNWLKDIDNYSDNDLEEALLNLFSSIDSPTTPANKGINQFVLGLTHQQKQEYRNKLLAVKREDIQRISEKYLDPNSIYAKNSSISIVGDQSKVSEAIQQNSAWEKIQLE
jgi:Zn-dependent M16 (insulinase) family peptidase